MKADPQTEGEWQDAVNAADFHLAIDSARQYGLIKTTARINVDRCLEIIERGKRKGIFPNWDKEQ